MLSFVQINELAANLVSQISPLGVETFSYLDGYFHSNKFASGQVNENALYQPFS